MNSNFKPEMFPLVARALGNPLLYYVLMAPLVGFAALLYEILVSAGVGTSLALAISQVFWLGTSYPLLRLIYAPAVGGMRFSLPRWLVTFALTASLSQVLLFFLATFASLVSWLEYFVVVICSSVVTFVLARWWVTRFPPSAHDCTGDEMT